MLWDLERVCVLGGRKYDMREAVRGKITPQIGFNLKKKNSPLVGYILS